MADLAIKGHATRGKEVIEILEMLGGRIMYTYNGDDDVAIYFIDGLYIMGYKLEDVKSIGFTVFTLEEFLEKFPYKVGDKILVDNQSSKILKMRWNSQNNKVYYTIENYKGIYTAEYLQPYKEEIMEERQYKELRMPLDDDDKLATEVTIDGNKILPPNGYLIGKITQLDNGMFVEYVKTQSQYSKTYDECCKVLGLEYIGIKRNENNYSANCYKNNLICVFVELFICRDAYWKIAGEQMGLGKSWKPDWNNYNEYKYCLYITGNNINKGIFYNDSHILAFPTEEMRDAFYENFKDLIEACKELL